MSNNKLIKVPLALLQQPKDTDCGVTCVAMLSSSSYDDIFEQFHRLKNWGIRTTSFRTTASDLSIVLKENLITVEKKRFKDWQEIVSPAIVGVDVGDGDRFHWVVVFQMLTVTFIADPWTGDICPLNARQKKYTPRHNKDFILLPQLKIAKIITKN